MFSIIGLQLLELQIPVFLIVLVVGIVIETYFVKHPFSFLIHFAISEACTLMVDPPGQFRVFLIRFWHFTWNTGGETGGVLMGVFKIKIKRLIAQTNSQ
jgi:hypothetical protein